MIGAALAGAAAAILSACAPMCAHHTSPAELERCTGAVVTVHGNDPVGCDVTPPQRLDVLEVTRPECDDMGGTYDAGTATCHDVDY